MTLSIEQADGRWLSEVEDEEAAAVAIRTHLLDDGESDPLFVFITHEDGTRDPMPILTASLLAGQIVFASVNR